MSVGSPLPGRCPHCGAPNPTGATTCQYCNGALSTAVPPTWSIGSPPPDNYRLVTPSPSVSPLAVVLIVVGIVLVLTGIALLATAAAVHQSVSSFNQACAQNPLCQPQPDPSGGMAAGGVVLLVVAVVLMAIGGSRYRS